MRTVSGRLLLATALALQGCAAVESRDHIHTLASRKELRLLIGTNQALDITRRAAFENNMRALVSDKLGPIEITNDRTAPYLSLFVHVLDAEQVGDRCSQTAYVVEAAYTERVHIRRPGRDQIQYATLWHEIAGGRTTPAELEQRIRSDVDWLVGRFVAGPVDHRIERPEYIGPPLPPPIRRDQ